MKMKILMVFSILLALGWADIACSEQNPLNVNEWGAAKLILVKAKQRIEKYGWQQGSVDKIKEECISTALENAWKNSGKSLVDFEYSRKAMSEAIGVPLQAVTYEDDPLSVPYWGRNFMYWNDAPGRTKDEVISAFDKAITISEENKTLAKKANITSKMLENFDKKSLRSMLQLK